MGVMIRLEAVGYRDLQGRFARGSRNLANARREMVRAVAGNMLLWLRHFAPQKTGVFAAGMAYRTDEAGGETRAAFYVRGEHAFLLPFFKTGTGIHGPKGQYITIPTGGKAAQMAKGYPLHWHDAQGAPHYAWEVHHPGMRPSPFIQQAQDAAEPFTRAAVQTVVRKAILSQ